MKNLTAEEILTWLNGRAISGIAIIQDDGSKHIIWEPEDATSIEDMVNSYINRNNIDARREISGSGA